MEDSLKTILHCDDKEMLKEKLALLQREYNRTVQRLQRAERSEAVRKHVKSNIAERRAFCQKESNLICPSSPCVTERQLCSADQSGCPVLSKSTALQSSPPIDVLSPSASRGVTEGFSRSSRLSGNSPPGSPVVGDESSATGQGHRQHSTHRLRSRRSWLRWENRERTESQKSKDVPDPASQQDRCGTSSLVLLSSPKEHQAEGLSPCVTVCSNDSVLVGLCEMEKEAVIALDGWTPHIPVQADGELQGNCAGGECDSSAEVQAGGTPVQVSETPGMKTNQLTQQTPLSPLKLAHLVPIEEAVLMKPEAPCEGKNSLDASFPPCSESSVTGLGSCTLIEGLLFPVEYYVRTTRRMASAQRSVDLGAVIQSQLSRGRKGRGRRGRAGSGAALHTEMLASKETEAHTPPGSECSQIQCSSTAAPDAEALLPKLEVGKRRRGRGQRRGRAQRRRYSLSRGPPSDPGYTKAGSPSTDANLKSVTDAHARISEKEVYPIFRTNGQLGTSSSPKISGLHSSEDNSQSNERVYLKALHRFSRRGLAYDSVHPPPNSEMVAPGQKHLSRGFLPSHFDIKDFHLPDDDFGSLKLEKLRTSTTWSLEASESTFSPYSTRQRSSRTIKNLQLVSSTSMEEPAGVVRQGSALTEGILNKAAGETVTVNVKGDKAVFGEKRRDQYGPFQARENGTQSTVLCSPTTLRGLGPEKVTPDVGKMSGSVETAVTGKGDLPQKCEVALVTAPSPHILNLSLTPALHIQEMSDPALPSWGSPTFPSPGITPAFPVHPISPEQNYPPLTAPNELVGTHAKPTPPSSHCPASQGTIISNKLGEETLQSSISHLPTAETECTSQNALRNEIERVPLQKRRASSKSTIGVRSLDAFQASLSDSIIGSLFHCKSPSAQLDDPAPSPSVDCPSVHSSPMLQEAESPCARLPLPCSTETHSTLRGVTEYQCARRSHESQGREADGSTASWQTASPAPLLSSLSQGADRGEDDLDGFFTDSAWPSGALPGPERDSAERQSETSSGSPRGVQEGPPTEILTLTHTLKAPTGRSLVDVCSVYAEPGRCVVTAEEWAVSVWQQSSSQGWHVLHTWIFTEHPVISLHPVSDAPGLLCVALGQLEIREARVLSLISAEGPFSQLTLCTGEVQVVLGVPGGRLACCLTVGSRQGVDVFRLTEGGRLGDSLSLVSPEQCVQALAAVEGQRDALIGSTDTSQFVLWNMKSGHLLQRFRLGESLSGTMCLRGYSQSGALFVLLQHRFLDQEGGVLFSLIAANPVNGKHALVQTLTRPAQCSGRFVDGDVSGSSLVAAFQGGALAVWNLNNRDCMAKVTLGPEGCHMAHWAGPSTILAGHLNGDVYMYKYTPLEGL